MKSPVRLDPADRLILFRRLDRFRKWQSLDDRRFCRCCHKLISGRQIEVIDPTAQDEAMRLVCPTTDCPSNVEDWVYPNEIAQPPDKWGRRVIRVVDSDGERFVVCGKSHGSYRRRLSQRFAFGSRTAAWWWRISHRSRRLRKARSFTVARAVTSRLTGANCLKCWYIISMFWIVIG